VGKSTVARALAARLGYRYISGGEMFREIARERGISVTEVNRLAEHDPAFDHDLDRRQRELAHAAGDCIVESRLSGWMVDADVKVWLRAPVEVRAARVAGREGQAADAARADLVERERSEWARYKAFYNIDVDDLSPYHLVIDTTRWSAEAIVDALEVLARAAGARQQARTRESEEARKPGPDGR
jgi:cytidylate kinase